MNIIDLLKIFKKALDGNPLSMRQSLLKIQDDTEVESFDLACSVLLWKWSNKDSEYDHMSSVTDILVNQTQIEKICEYKNDICDSIQFHVRKITGNLNITNVENYIKENKRNLTSYNIDLLYAIGAFEQISHSSAPQSDQNQNRTIIEYGFPPFHSEKYAFYLGNLNPDIKDRVGQSISRVFTHLPDPEKSGLFAGRYLCVGQVQSGKTSHFTGIIAAAAGQGYKLVIVLAGRTRSLRNQTQSRLNKDLIGVDGLTRWLPFTSETKRNCATDESDFTGGVGLQNPLRQLLINSQAGVLVIKKNHHILDRLIESINDLNDSQKLMLKTLIIDDESDEAGLNGYRLPNLGATNGSYTTQFYLDRITTNLRLASTQCSSIEQLNGEQCIDWLYRLVTQECPKLFPDLDENIQHSMVENWYKATCYLKRLKDAELDLEQDDTNRLNIEQQRDNLDSLKRSIEAGDILFMRSGINRRLLTLFSALGSHCYLGYTATPSANILTNCEQENDLFPRHRIFSLETSDAYKGLDYFYPHQSDDTNPPPDTRFLVCTVSGQERNDVLSANLQQPPPALCHAVAYFFMASAVFQKRENAPKDTTMLVHGSHEIITHQYIKGLVEVAVNSFINNCDSFIEVYQKVINSLCACEIRKKLNYTSFNFNDVKNDAVRLARELISNNSITLENSDTDNEDRIEYPEDNIQGPAQPGCHIVVGGNILARGLTLKRLLSSYFLRLPGNQSGLLQMARWFGHWTGYEDLVRLWTTDDINLEFAAIAIKERDVLDQIQDLPAEIGSPEEIAITINYRRGIKPTSPHLMKTANRLQNNGLHIGGAAIETRKFKHKDKLILNRNIIAAKNLINDSIQNNGTFIQVDNGERRLIRGVSNFLIEKFFHDYYLVCDDFKSLTTAYANLSKSSQLWNVGIIGAKGGDVFEWHPNCSLGKVSRLRLADNQPLINSHIAYINDLTRDDDTFFDLIGEIPAPEYDTAFASGRSRKSNFAKLRSIYNKPPLLSLFSLNENHKLPNGIQNSVKADWDGVSPCIAWSISLPSTVGVGGALVYANSSLKCFQ